MSRRFDPADDIGHALGQGLSDIAGGLFEKAMKAMWGTALQLLHGAFSVADRFSTFSLSISSGPLHAVWPVMVWLSGVLAIGLFFWQLTVTQLHGGRGFLRLVTGPAQYGVALGVTIGAVATFLAAIDEVTRAILTYGLSVNNFSDAMQHTTFLQVQATAGKFVVLGVCAIVCAIPAAFLCAIEMVFREAAIVVLAACVPIVAAGLLARATARWFWMTLRWLIAVIAMKPVLALTLAIGVSVAGGAQDVAGLLAGLAVLVISMLAPFVLFRLLAFVDPNTDAGGGLRSFFSGTSGGAGFPQLGPATGGGSESSGGQERANTSRFDDAAASGDSESPEAGGGSLGGPSDAAGGPAQPDDGGQQKPPDEATGGSDKSPAAESAGSGGGAGTPEADPAQIASGGSGGHTGGEPGRESGDDGGAAAGAADAAVIV